MHTQQKPYKIKGVTLELADFQQRLPGIQHTHTYIFGTSHNIWFKKHIHQN
ncbi:hypothetical protein [Aquimarina algiphila]|uniref:hypothetical protein n=1 Tax=Aquimarina algiphila TaxID=2047982 RepID=UPI002491CE9C|nr:hypothetical protein [Aquimarina algiphila]